MRHWNYRVVHRAFDDPTGVGPWDIWMLIEAYYDDLGVLVNWHSEVEALGDNLEELRGDLVRMVRALELPVIEYEDLPQPKKEETDD